MVKNRNFEMSGHEKWIKTTIIDENVINKIKKRNVKKF